MTQFPHDQFAKDLLETLLRPFGEVQTAKTVDAQVRQIDVYFHPNPTTPSLPNLGLLHKLAATPATFEPFRKAVTVSEICSCIAKLFDLHGELTRQAKREQQSKLTPANLPHLWILTPTLSAEKLADFGAIKDVETWGEGIYLLPKSLKTGIVVLHQLPATAETLWLRILGRDNVQIRAIAEISRLSRDNPYRQNALELFSNLKIVLENKQDKNVEETELIMNLSPLYLEQIDIATQKGRAVGEATGIETGIATGIATGIERGRMEEGKSLIIRQLTRKLGELDPETIEQIDRLTLVQIESLGDALLDFDRMEDLFAYLQS
jgi:Domain of unknown function (DUF4351)